MAKDKDYVQLIHTERWLRLRRDKLTASPLCERCQQAGLLTPATEVHHVTPVEDGLTYTANEVKRKTKKKTTKRRSDETQRMWRQPWKNFLVAGGGIFLGQGVCR